MSINPERLQALLNREQQQYKVINPQVIEFTTNRLINQDERLAYLAEHRLLSRRLDQRVGDFFGRAWRHKSVDDLTLIREAIEDLDQKWHDEDATLRTQAGARIKTLGRIFAAVGDYKTRPLLERDTIKLVQGSCIEVPTESYQFRLGTKSMFFVNVYGDVIDISSWWQRMAVQLHAQQGAEGLRIFGRRMRHALGYSPEKVSKDPLRVLTEADKVDMAVTFPFESWKIQIGTKREEIKGPIPLPGKETDKTFDKLSLITR